MIILFEHRHRRTCHVGGKWTYLILRVPDTHRSTNHSSSYSVCRSRSRPCTWSQLLVTTLKKWAMNYKKIAENEDLVPKRKATSVIWNYFGYKKDDIDQTRVLCWQCFASVATTRGNTTNLFDHLRWYHTAQYDKKVRSVQVNWPQDGSSEASHKVLFRSSDENSCIFFISQYISQSFRKIAISVFSNIVQLYCWSVKQKHSSKVVEEMYLVTLHHCVKALHCVLCV